jgi:hypothetical protein
MIMMKYITTPRLVFALDGKDCFWGVGSQLSFWVKSDMKLFRCFTLLLVLAGCAPSQTQAPQRKKLLVIGGANGYQHNSISYQRDQHYTVDAQGSRIIVNLANRGWTCL